MNKELEFIVKRLKYLIKKGYKPRLILRRIEPNFKSYAKKGGLKSGDFLYRYDFNIKQNIINY